VSFIDDRSLVEPGFLDCKLTRNAPKTRFGLAVEPVGVLRNFVRIERECGIETPHVVFDLSGPQRTDFRELQSVGYEPVFVQFASIPPAKTPKRVTLGQFIAVRRDILDRVSAMSCVDYDLGEILELD
jgi:hypothetical protein